MARDISVSIAVQGEKEFNQALKSAQSAVKVLASELKASEASFDENADAQAYFANRTRIINDQIEQERTILRSLEQAVREAGEEFGEASTKTDRYRIEINRTQASISKLERELRETQREAEELGRDSTRVGRQIESGLGDAAEDAAGKLDKMMQQIERDMNDIGSAVEFSAFSDLGSMFANGIEFVVSGVESLTEGTVEYRRQMAILEQNAKDLGFDPDWLRQQAAGIAALTGDMDGAVEAVSNLARIAPDVDGFTLVLNRLLGATIAWPETFKIENLSESLQESLASHQITGAYSELMSRLGLDAETINKSLEEAAKVGEEAVWTAGTAWTSEHGFEKTIEEFRAMNSELIAYNESKIKLQESEAMLAEKLTPAATEGIKMFAGMIDSITAMITAYENYQAEVEATRQAAQEAGTQAEEIAKDAIDNSGIEDAAVDLNDKIIEAYQNGDYLLAKQLEAQHAQIIQEIGETKQEAEEVLEQGSDEEGGGFWEKLLGGGGEAATQAAVDAVDELTSGIEDSAEKEKENMQTVGENIATNVGNGIVEGTPEAVEAAASMWRGIQSELTRQITIPAPKLQKGTYDGAATLKGGGNGLGGSSHVELVAQIDKTTVARATSGEINSLLGESTERAERYG